ncbi:MAG TPA: DUF5626 family protein [Pseudogracilibacillus sp.]|nr:DUF5626 family protein [Pseudogracilibacillus sp.]
MKKWLFSILIVTISFLIFGGQSEKAHANEKSIIENEIEFDLSKNEVQSTTYNDKNGEEVTVSIEPVKSELESIYENINQDNTFTTYQKGHAFPFGTSSYKVIVTRPHMGMSFFVTVNVPKSNPSNAKITKAYNANHWILGGTISETKLTRTNKVAKYSGNSSLMGGYAGSSVWLKGTLGKNAIMTISYRF